MNYQIIEGQSNKYIELNTYAAPLNTENDALDLISLCWEHETNALMIPYEILSEDFFKLKTKIAGDIIQKFTNYGIKAAITIPKEIDQNERFKEMVLEINKGNHFRFYASKNEAEKWLLN